MFFYFLDSVKSQNLVHFIIVLYETFTNYLQILQYLDPILRVRNLQLQRQCCGRLERFFNVEENIFVSKTH
jgi:hypothetical protein